MIKKVEYSKVIFSNFNNTWQKNYVYYTDLDVYKLGTQISQIVLKRRLSLWKVGIAMIVKNFMGYEVLIKLYSINILINNSIMILLYC